MKPVIECIRDYVMTFPELKDGSLLVDCLGNEAVAYMVETVPCDPIYKKYTDGGTQKQFKFIFASREYYGENVNKNIENIGFYEHFANWIADNNLNEIYPDLDGRIPCSLEVVSGAYAYDTTANTAQYQMQLMLIYEEE